MTHTADSFLKQPIYFFLIFPFCEICHILTKHFLLKNDRSVFVKQIIFLLLRWTSVQSFRCLVTLYKSTSIQIYFPVCNFQMLAMCRWQTRGTCSVQQPWQSCIWGSFCAAKWTSQTPTRSVCSFIYLSNILSNKNWTFKLEYELLSIQVKCYI